MRPVYTDIHIHTSENADKLNESYDVNELVKNIKLLSKDYPILISLTDHNTVNKSAYISLLENKEVNVILGVELHIRKHENAEPYHCHLLFDTEICEKSIDNLNRILDTLYPKKMVCGKDDEIPNIEEISNSFGGYDFIMLPHGGQSHSTFDKAISGGTNFDSALERSIYYNHFDGFTARSNKSLEGTLEYFKKLGINEFINLVTCTDNYNPKKYPKTKVDTPNEFIPTWMYAEPTFSGLRLSLSESSRLCYDNTPPIHLMEYIEKVELNNELVDIDVKMTPGLNVVIGGSSSGKTMFIDLIYRNTKDNYEDNTYVRFETEKANVHNPSGMVPHYIDQNFIISILQSDSKGIEEIDIIANVFPQDSSEVQSIRDNLKEFKSLLEKVVDLTSKIESYEKELNAIPILSRLIITGTIKQNLFDKIKPNDSEYNSLKFEQSDVDKYSNLINQLEQHLEKNPLSKNLSPEIEKIMNEIKRLNTISDLSEETYSLINKYKRQEDERLSKDNEENQKKKTNKDKLIQLIERYVISLKEFYSTIDSISKLDIEYRTKELNVAGHRLYIENKFKLCSENFVEVVNNCLKKEHRIEDFDIKKLKPEVIFRDNYSAKPKVNDYNDFINKVYGEISGKNTKKYKIITKEDKKFEELSPGWKSAVILDLVLGYEEDSAPIIIDQPEDNLATDYINRNLVDLIKVIKTRKQVILVSHNATIPMLGDAQNLILCKNDSGKITIRSAPLEGEINDKAVLDYIAEITDGGKSSIKKRVKKYNLKSYKGEAQ